jgi:acyl-CoA synthetase (AMP-forming)/AMP-acid ligase II
MKLAMLDWWGDSIYEYYAATEGGGTLVTPEEWRRYPGTVGRPWTNSDIKIYDDDGGELPPGEHGTVFMKLGQADFEYHKDKDKTRKSRRGEYFTVGDIGYLNEEGYLFLCDRKSDMIISGGVNIYPAEIENVMLTHPKVADVAVFGIPHQDWGEEVKAVVQSVDDVEIGDALTQDILAFCGDKLAKYKTPRSIDYIEEMPRDPNGKLYKRKLRDPYWEEHGFRFQRRTGRVSEHPPALLRGDGALDRGASADGDERRLRPGRVEADGRGAGAPGCPRPRGVRRPGLRLPGARPRARGNGTGAVSIALLRDGVPGGERHPERGK